MTKYPKSLWVVFDMYGMPIYVKTHKSYLVELRPYKRYHLHPGNKVARAQIVKDLNYLYECPSRMGAAMVAERFGVGFKGMRFV